MGFINLLLTVLIIGFLVAHVPQKYWDMLGPGSPAKQQQKKEMMAAPDRTRQLVWSTLGQQVSNAVQTFHATYSRMPARIEDLQTVGLDVQKKDPWGGKLYLKGNQLRCTGNPKVFYSLW